IHVPCLEGSSQAVLLRLYDEVLGIFSGPNAVAARVCARVAAQLEAALARPADATLVDALLSAARAVCDEERQLASRGRDRLLELNSCRPDEARTLLARAEAEGGTDPAALHRFLELLFDAHGL